MTNEKWENITREELLDLYVSKNYINADVAKLFGVTKSQVEYKRKKLNITQSCISYRRLVNGAHDDLLVQINNNSKQSVLTMDLHVISRALAHYIFRNGPVEDMHAAGKLNDEDMKTLNKFANNKIATLLQLLKDEDWFRISLLLEMRKYYGSDWDMPDIELEELDRENELFIQLFRK